MSQENVEIAKAGFRAWNTGDMDALRELYEPDVVLRMPEGWPEPGPYVGREAVMRQLEQMRETWDTDTFELISDFIDVADRVLVRFIWHGAGYGPEANIEATNVFMMRKGRIFLLEAAPARPRPQPRHDGHRGRGHREPSPRRALRSARLSGGRRRGPSP
jgi:ketosteroid isomerase-like protein